MSGNQAPINPESWYLPTPITLSPVAQEVFTRYVNLPTAEVIPHITAVRNKAWKIFPYPCLGTFRFLDFSISDSPAYSAIVARLQDGDTLLDLGCCIGQDIRKLVSDGAPSANIYGADLKAEFIELGYELFQDRATLKSVFTAPTDVFDPSADWPLAWLERAGGVDVVHVSAFLHLFSYRDQVRAAKRVVGLLKKRVGSVVFGKQGGNLVPGEFVHKADLGRTIYRHDKETFERFWNVDVGGGEWGVEVEMIKPQPKADVTERIGVIQDESARWLNFVVTLKKVEEAVEV